MKFPFLLILISLVLSCSSNFCEGERRLTASQEFEDYKNGLFYSSDVPWINLDGNEISVDSMMKMDSEKYSRDLILDCQNNSIRNEIRLRTEADRKLILLRDEFNYYNLDNYIAFIEFYESDPDLRARMIDYANSHSALETVEVDCNDIFKILAQCYFVDQDVRNGGDYKGSMSDIDRENMIQLESIVKNCGFDAIMEEGSESVEHAWFIVQHGHAQLRKKYLDDFRNCVDKGLLQFKTMALMIDRSLMDEGNSQIYGSQFRYDSKLGKNALYPVQDFERMVFLRDSIGLMPIEEYAEKLGGVVVYD